MALADDNHSKTRAYALDALHTLVCAAKKLDIIDADVINNVTRGELFLGKIHFKSDNWLTNNIICLVALARLNDNPGKTRSKAIHLLKATYAKPLPNDYTVHYEAHVDQLYKTVVIFLDDEDIQQPVFGNYWNRN